MRYRFNLNKIHSTGGEIPPPPKTEAECEKCGTALQVNSPETKFFGGGIYCTPCFEKKFSKFLKK